MSSPSMEKIENVAGDVVFYDNVVGRIHEEVAQCDQLNKPIVILVRDQGYHHVQVWLVKKRFL